MGKKKKKKKKGREGKKKKKKKREGREKKIGDIAKLQRSFTRIDVNPDLCVVKCGKISQR